MTRAARRNAGRGGRASPGAMAATVAGSFAGPIIAAALFPLLLVVIGLETLLDRWTLRAGHAAEYAADRASARIAGRDGAVGVMRALLTATAMDRFLQRTPAARGDAVLARRFADSIPDSERLRLTRLADRRLTRIDSSHPPTILRLELVSRGEPSAPALTVTDSEMAGIDDALRVVTGHIASHRSSAR